MTVSCVARSSIEKEDRGADESSTFQRGILLVTTDTMKRAYQETAEEDRVASSRNVSTKVSTEPISINDVESLEAKAAFEKWLDAAAAAALHRDDDEENQSPHDVEPWIEATLQTIEQFPILSRAVDQNGFSLLYFSCEVVGSLPEEEKHYAVDALKTLIESNPHALVWNIKQKQDPLTMICKCLSAILPWIIKQYPWVFGEQDYSHQGRITDYLPSSHPAGVVTSYCCDGCTNDFSPALLKGLLDQCPRLISLEAIEGGITIGTFLLVHTVSNPHHPELLDLLEFMIRKQPEFPLASLHGQTMFVAALSNLLYGCEQSETGHEKDDLDSCYFKILKIMLNLCPSAALVPSTNYEFSSEILPIDVLLSHFAKHGGGLALIELLAHIARIMYPNFEESANVKDNALMKKVLAILDKEKEATVMSIRLKRSKLMFSKGTTRNKEAQDLYGCWVTNQLIQLNDQIKQYREKDIPALKDWKEEPQDDDGSDEQDDDSSSEEEDDDSSEEDDDESDEEGINDGGDAGGAQDNDE